MFKLGKSTKLRHQKPSVDPPTPPTPPPITLETVNANRKRARAQVRFCCFNPAVQSPGDLPTPGSCYGGLAATTSVSSLHRRDTSRASRRSRKDPVEEDEGSTSPRRTSTSHFTLELPVVSTRLRKLSEAFFNAQLGGKVDLMNDWEIGGTQNKWVCPSDRHLQLRAQLKSGWSVRTATARSPTNSKGQNGQITEAEQEQIRMVLAKAEESKQKEQQRIGKMVDRLEKMRRRATGNGVTHCLLCHTEFGLLASKSYAAMCMDCRKYVCQRNCGVETMDPSRNEVVFLCKICSEAREVLWKKSGAWFYKEMPDFVRPELGVPSTSYANGSVVSPPPTTVTTVTAPTSIGSPRKPPSWAIGGLPPNGGTPNGGTPMSNGSTPVVQRRPTLSNEIEIASNSPSRVSVILPKEMPERARSPRPRIQPSWVKEKVMSSMSVDDEERAGSSSDGEGFAQAGVPRRPAKQNHNSTSRREANLARFALHAARISDSEDDSSPESRGSTRSTSPRRSLATPCSCDAVASNDAAHDDARSIDSGVVQSDHSNPQAGGHLTLSSSSLTPFTNGHVPNGDVAGGSPRRISQPESGQRVTQSSSGISLVTPPPATQQNRMSAENLSRHSRTNSPALSMEHRASNASSVSSGTRRIASAEPPAVVEYRMDPNTVIRNDSPLASFMSSTDEESSTLGSIQFNVTYFQNEKKLVINLLKAKNLKAMDSNGFSDPYVKLHLIPGNAKATKLTSRTIEKTLNPVWNEEMVYYGITEEDKAKKTLRVTVLDRDRIGSDFLGETRIALRKLPNNELKKYNLYLENAIPVPAQKKEEEGAERGKIHVGIQYNIQQGSLFVHINRCVELVGMDSTGFSDPYCKISLTPVTSKSHRQRTSIKKRTLNPDFSETIQFVVPFKDLPKKTLQIGVYDHDLGKHDDYIGGILLSTSAKDERGKQWIGCIENPGTLMEGWHKLELDT